MSSEICVVTGGAGFIGCALSSGLATQFDGVVVIDCLHPQIHVNQMRPAALDPRVELIVADIANPDAWDSLLLRFKPTLLIHLAAETGTGQSLTESVCHTPTNVTGTATMIDALRRNNAIPKRIILSSSRAIYGEGTWQRDNGRSFNPGQRTREQLAQGQWDFEGSPLPMSAQKTVAAPVSVYGATKLAQEHILGAWSNATGSELLVLRLQNVYGPGQSLINSYTGIVSLFCQNSRKKEGIPLYEDGMMLRDFILIDDVKEAFLLAAAIDAEVGFQIFDVGMGMPSSLKEVADQIAQIYDAPLPKITGQYRYGDVRHAYCDTTVTSQVLGWKPRFSLEQGLRCLAEWIEGQSVGG